MPNIDDLLSLMRNRPASMRFSDLERVCRHYFGEPRQAGGSHQVYKMPWPGDPRVNIRNDRGKAKPYQVKQVLAAITRLEEES